MTVLALTTIVMINQHIVECAEELCRDNKQLFSLFGTKSKTPSWIESIWVLQNSSAVYVGWYSFNTQQAGDLFAVILFGRDDDPREIIANLKELLSEGPLLPQILQLRTTSKVPWPVIFTVCTIAPGYTLPMGGAITREFIVDSTDSKEVENTLVNYERWFMKEVT